MPVLRDLTRPSLASVALLIVRRRPAPAAGEKDVGEGDEAAPTNVHREVTRVVDGDTVEAEIDGREEDVRYIGVDTPESVKPDSPVECYGARGEPISTPAWSRARRCGWSSAPSAATSTGGCSPTSSSATTFVNAELVCGAATRRR